ncbi:MAG: hypothetical protein ACTSVV_08730 [Promethearchaeota archaeon]
MSTLPESIGNLIALEELHIADTPLARNPTKRTRSILKNLEKNGVKIIKINFQVISYINEEL